jgi:hypothetical protein
MRQESIFEDGAQLLASGDERREAVLTELDGLGVDTIRVLAVWRDVARDGWGPIDAVVRGASARGMDVLLTPTAPIPRSASGCRPRGASCKPSVRGYRRFVRVAGRRYSGSFHGLPRVARWSLWNEPNLATWLSPQFASRGGRVVDVGALAYRRLAGAGVAALRATGHGSDEILLGETAPVGRFLGPLASRPADPVTFLRTLLAGGPRLRVSGYAHHPYTQGAGAPPDGPIAPGQISFTNLGRLKRLLAFGARRGVLPRHLPIWLTEFGYQTNPPDFRLGVSYEAQAEYLNFFDWVASRDPRVRSVSQYKLVDDPNVVAFQTGLRRFGSLDAKPALTAYQLPIWVARRGRFVRVYGQVRPARRARVRVALEVDGRVVHRWRVAGQFVRRVAYRPGGWRLVWTRPDGSVLASRVASAR